MSRSPHRRNRAWHVHAVTLGLALFTVSCSDDVVAPRNNSNAVPPTSVTFVNVADPEAPPLGIGGSVTLTASGGRVTGIPMRPSGIVLPPGIPVRVQVTGQITRVQQPGFTFFCSFFVALCASLAPMLGEAPINPWGVPIVDGAIAQASWDGGEPSFAQQGSATLLSGMSGSELWIGRIKFECDYGWIFGSGPCYQFGGGYTWVVRADDGGNGDPAAADLRLAITSQDVGPSGGPVSLQASTSDNSPATEIRWFFVPDGGGTFASKPTAANAVVTDASSATAEEAAHLTISGASDVVQTASGARPVVTRAQSSDAVMTANARVQNSSSSYQSLSQCDDSMTCSAVIEVPAGTFVVKALVHGTPRAADQRVAEGNAGGGGGNIEIRIVSAKGRNPNESFTSLAGENLIDLVAEVSEASLEPEIEWIIEDNPDPVRAIPPQNAPNGKMVTVQVPGQDVGRWNAVPHDRDLTKKRLAFRVTAMVKKDGKEYKSEPVVVEADEIDTARQEYIDFARNVAAAARGRWGTQGSTYFDPSELNQGDYNVFLTDRTLLARMDVIREQVAALYAQMKLPFGGLFVTSFFRNPVHHRIHEGLGLNNSPHLYGTGIDIRVKNRPGFNTPEEFWEELRDLAYRRENRLCFEPADMIRERSKTGELDHAHFDYRGGTCPRGW